MILSFFLSLFCPSPLVLNDTLKPFWVNTFSGALCSYIEHPALDIERLNIDASMVNRDGLLGISEWTGYLILHMVLKPGK